MFFKLLVVGVAIHFVSGSVVQQLQDEEECCEEYCYDTDTTDSIKPQYKKFATKSAYAMIKGTDIEHFAVSGITTLMYLCCEPG